MNQQLSLFEGLALRDAGTKVALEVAPLDWKLAAEAWLMSQRDAFTADDLVAAIGKPASTESNRNNAIGGYFQRWLKMGLIEQAGFTQGARPESHGRVLRVWRMVMAGRREVA